MAKRVGRVLRRVTDLVPITPLGIGVAVGGDAALKWLAYPELDLVWLVVGYAALGMVGLGVIAVLIAAALMKLRRRPGPRSGRTETMFPTGTEFRVPSLALLPLLQVRWEWEEPEGVRVETARRFGRLEELATLPDRGEVHGVVRRILVQDAFGLARMAVRQRDPLRLDVLPHVGALAQLPILASLAGGDETPHPMGIDDGDRVELRRYVPGDPARFIHWKIYARARKLMVRVPERALTRARRTIAYLVAGEDDGASAAAARVAVQTDALAGEWTFTADGSNEDAKTAEHALRLIVRSSSARDAGAAGLEAALARAERSGPATAVIFAPPRPGAWLDRVLAAVRKRKHRTRVVIATDGVAPLVRVPWWKRALVIGAGRRDATPAEALEQVLRALGTLRCEVVVLDRRTGRRLGEVHREAMKRLEQAA